MNDKELVAHAALDYVEDNMIIGLGTGSTANYFIDGLANKIKSEGLSINVVASSTVSQERANEAGIKYISIDQIEKIDLYVDGADEITNDLVLLKGRGYDLVKEKLLASSSSKFIVIADKSKIVAKISEKFPIPIEITPIAWKITKNTIEKISKTCVLRKNAAGDAYAITSCGNFVLDCHIEYDDIRILSKVISEIPGVFEHGIFYNLPITAIIANQGNISQISY
ncbi:MAG: ribose 5-phosphate isomerase A [Methylophilaceae bacterium]|nr:ribose 5-phosphate isomerase A [Methylophilaceae bacterium]